MPTTSPLDTVVGLFDSYSRVARLYPSVIALAPILWSGVALFPSLLESASQSIAFVIGSACLLFFFTSITRSLGKRTEARLLRQQGGWHTTMLLRHRDATLDGTTKERYHRALEVMCACALPTLKQEQTNPADADAIYRSATKKLIEQRRGAEYVLLHAENASYGFRRNLYGLKPVALIETVIVILLTLFGWWLITPQPYTRLVIAQSVISYPHFLVLVGLDLGYLFLWLWAVTPDFVAQAGREYAEALLRTLDA